MTNHPYIRAYLAGLALPSLIIPVILLCYVFVRYGFAMPIPLERVLIFPLALVPNIFGLWNMLYQRVRRSSSIHIGAFGAMLPFLILPCGYLVARALGILTLQQTTITWFGELTAGYGLIVADECHHVPAAAFEHAVKQIPARRWLGLTATPYRRDKLDDLIAMQVGPVRHTIALSRDAVGQDTLLRLPRFDGQG